MKMDEQTKIKNIQYKLQFIVDDIETHYDVSKFKKIPLYHLYVIKRIYDKLNVFINTEYKDYDTFTKRIIYWYRYKYDNAVEEMYMPPINASYYHNYAEVKSFAEKCMNKFIKIMEDGKIAI
ncbi:MAG: hypothetical protein RSE41_02415 [Clostridia bacterium]